jgi:hypothetical protein
LQEFVALELQTLDVQALVMHLLLTVKKLFVLL